MRTVHEPWDSNAIVAPHQSIHEEEEQRELDSQLGEEYGPKPERWGSHQMIMKHVAVPKYQVAKGSGEERRGQQALRINEQGNWNMCSKED